MNQINVSYGFEPGIYMRLRTNSLGSYPTSVTWGIYNSDTASSVCSGTLGGFTTFYQIKYIKKLLYQRLI